MQDNLFLLTPHRTYSRQEADNLAFQWASELKTRGLRAGSVHKLVPTLCAETIFEIMGAFQFGATVALIPGSWSLDLRDGPRDDNDGGAGTIFLTSGTTSTPKPIFHHLHQHFSNATAVVETLSFGPGCRWLLNLPLYHVGGFSILIRAMLSGGAIQLPDTNDTPTHISMVPTQLYRLLREPEKIARLQSAQIIVGGAPTPQDLLDRAIAAGLTVIPSYGMTEMASQVALGGKILADRNVVIFPDQEIHVSGPMLGYYRGSTGSHATGDLGHMDTNGVLSIIGRRDNMLISGGENIHPEEIEAALLSHPDVLQALVVPITSAEFGQRPVAFVQTNKSTLPLAQFLADCLPRFKIPDHFFPWPQIPETMKPSRKQFKDLLRTFLS